MRSHAYMHVSPESGKRRFFNCLRSFVDKVTTDDKDAAVCKGVTPPTDVEALE